MGPEGPYPQLSSVEEYLWGVPLGEFSGGSLGVLKDPESPPVPASLRPNLLLRKVSSGFLNVEPFIRTFSSYPVEHLKVYKVQMFFTFKYKDPVLPAPPETSSRTDPRAKSPF